MSSVDGQDEQVQYHPTAEKLKVKKTRHRRNGSHSSSIRDSPHWDRKVRIIVRFLESVILFFSIYLILTKQS